MPAGMASGGTCRPLRSSASSSSSRAHPVLLDLPDRDLVDVGFTAVAAHQLPLSLHDVSAVDLVVRHVESSPGVSLLLPPRRALQSSNRVDLFDARDGLAATALIGSSVLHTRGRSSGPFPCRAANLLPGLLAVTSTGLSPGCDELVIRSDRRLSHWECHVAYLVTRCGRPPVREVHLARGAGDAPPAGTDPLSDCIERREDLWVFDLGLDQPDVCLVMRGLAAHRPSGGRLEGWIDGRAYLHGAVAVLVHLAVVDGEHRPDHPSEVLRGFSKSTHRRPKPARQHVHVQVPLLG